MRLPTAAGSIAPSVARARLALEQDLLAEAAWPLLGELASAGLIPESARAQGVSVTLAEGARVSRIEVHEARVGLHHDAQRAALELTASSDEAPNLTGRLDVDYRARSATAELIVIDATVPQLSLAAAHTQAESLTVYLSAAIADGRVPELAGLVDLRGLTLQAPVLAPDAITPLAFRYSFTGEYDPGAEVAASRPGLPYLVRRHLPRGRLSLSEGTLVVNGVRLATRVGLIGLGRRRPHPVSGAPAALPRRLTLGVELAPTAVSRIAEAVPPAMRGRLAGLEVEGVFSWQLLLEVPRYNPGRAQWQGNGRLRRFAVRSIPEEVNPYNLNRSFLHTIRDPAVDYLRTVRIPAAAAEHQPLFPSEPPPGTPPPEAVSTGARGFRSAPDRSYTYVRLWEMSEWVPKSVLTAEDGDFYYHGGVNFRTLAQAAARNLRAGEVVLGASTISMQLAKLLFLDDDRIFSRKLQEVFLVYLMEHEVPVTKERILEIYLNIAEFGPAVFGIHDAARYYFDADPADLTVGEAMFLATLLPSPKRYHWYYARGEITEGWFVRMKSYYDVMLERERMTEEEYEEAIEEKPTFAK
jgi:hypothetical protein